MRLYETMFLVDNARAKDNPELVANELKEMVARAGGQVVNCDKWDERKLAYEIAHQRRGTYVLCHWHGDPQAPAKLERLSKLSGMVLRSLTILDEDGIEITKPHEEAQAKKEPSGGPEVAEAAGSAPPRGRGGKSWRA